MIHFTVPGEPVAKGRPKVSTVNGHVQLRTPSKTVNYESKVSLFAHQAMEGQPPIEGPVSLSVKAVFQAPSSWSKKRAAANRITPEFVTKRPDLDNVIKALCDGMNGVVFKDDSQVANLFFCVKLYGEDPRVEVTVARLP